MLRLRSAPTFFVLTCIVYKALLCLQLPVQIEMLDEHANTKCKGRQCSHHNPYYSECISIALHYIGTSNALW